ncbi:hypothetical protein J5N97_005028 [Dioscorea zingiberensis]|uniref:Uncharacterized protein n=1 Tax=Dioscorea zingiberensis TaxID=325984 RepID=A0A9D5HSQ2_9LILI|nr:hypothetical protein J5N97_005028 [Dioscorea zingiberensis]
MAGSNVLLAFSPHLPSSPSSPLRSQNLHPFFPPPLLLLPPSTRPPLSKSHLSFPFRPIPSPSPPPLFSSPLRSSETSEYVFPDPIPEFAEAETEKFRTHLLTKLSKKDIFGNSVEEVVGVCTEILSNFLHTEYGGPGTLLVIPFIDMADTLNERGLPGGPQAARAAVVWAQKHIDKDWKEWTGDD